MSRRAQVRLLPDGRRLHLQDGPIDLVIEGCGSSAAIRQAYAAAALAFDGLLDELCGELVVLRNHTGGEQPCGLVARAMAAAVAPYAAETFVTPMAAVAGAVADHILGAMRGAARLTRAYVNNGGDIALHLDAGAEFRIGMVDRPDRPGLFGHVVLDGGSPVRGVATSGWRGRSFSLGIADAVTVLGATAAQADAAATIVANAVDLPSHRGVERVAACDLQPDSDLGGRRVTRGVPALSRIEIARALGTGAEQAEDLVWRGLIQAAALHLQGATRIVGSPLRLAGSSFTGSVRRAAAHV